MDNAITNYNTDGSLNTQYYITSCHDIIERTAAERGYDTKKITTLQFKPLLRACYNSLFKPSKTTFCNNKCNIPYNPDNITTLLNIYTELCEYYNCIPSLYGFERFTGITEDTTQKYVTASRLEIVKQRKSFIQDKLTESPVGVIALANNDQDSGLMYTRQNVLEKETIKQGLSLNDFVKISDKTSK